VLDVRYDIERRVKRLLPRDLSNTENLVFAELLQTARTPSSYAWKQPAIGTAANLRNTMERWTKSLAIVETTAIGSPDRRRQLVRDTIAREAELAREAPTGSYQRLSPGPAMLHAQ